MLSHADARLIKRDPAIAGLSNVLDPDVMLDLLRLRAPQSDLQEVRISYVKYKPGTNCLAGFALRTGDRWVHAYAKAFNADGLAKLMKAAASPGVPSPLGPGRLVFEDSALTVSIFPNDSHLPSLVRLENDEARSRLLKKMVSPRPDFSDGEMRTLVYKPNRRYVGQLISNGQPKAVVKAYVKSDFQRTNRSAKIFKAGDLLKIAPRLGRSTTHGVLVLEWMPGRLLQELISGPQFELDEIVRVGQALAELHSHHYPKLRYGKSNVEAESLLEMTEVLKILCPSRTKSLDRLAPLLAEGIMKDSSSDFTVIHGDFYAKQVILSADGGVVILDLDEATRGEPERDVGNFIAHLYRDYFCGRLPAERIEPIQEALQHGYESAGGRTREQRLQFYVCLSLFRLATLPFRDREPSWPQSVKNILDLSESISEFIRGRPVHQRLKTRADSEPVPVRDPFDSSNDPQMPCLAPALDPAVAQRHLRRCLASRPKFEGTVDVQAIRVVKHKPGRRAVIRYEVSAGQNLRPPLALIAKVRAKGPDRRTFRLLGKLRNRGFHDNSSDGVCIPKPIGVIPELGMWLQREVQAPSTWDLLAGEEGSGLATRIARAIFKLHQTPPATSRRHTIADELQILTERLSSLGEMKPEWNRRIHRILTVCHDRAAATEQRPYSGIHRDFYPDQVLVEGRRVYLIDFDLYSIGDPALDVGNFLAHLTEYALRVLGDPQALAGQQEAFLESYLELAGKAFRLPVDVYAFLSLARHLHISTLFPERRDFTESLLELCENQAGEIVERAAK